MIEIVHQLRMASGSNAKKRILEMYRHNDDWLEVLKAMYDTSINYYTSAPHDTTFIEEINVNDLLAALDLLSSRHHTGNAARAFALDCSQEYGEIFRLILGGSLKAGVSTTTINKVYPGLIPEFKVMLAKDAKLIRYPVLASTKYDGVRLVVVIDPRRAPALILRSGKHIQIESLSNAVKDYEPGVYDGELVSGDGLQAGRTVITGQVNRCLKGTDTDITDYTFCVFDYIPLEAWNRRQCTWEYHQRLRMVNLHVDTTAVTRAAEQFELFSGEQVEELYQDHIERGYEGLILRDESDPYLWTRSATLMKKKATKEARLMCTEVLEGKGKYAGMVGSLRCVGKAEGQDVLVNVGSGLSDHQREQPFSEYRNKTIEVLYNDVVRASGARINSLFLPRFKRVVGDYNI